MFFNDTATTEIYTLSLHDALPIFPRPRTRGFRLALRRAEDARAHRAHAFDGQASAELDWGSVNDAHARRGEARRRGGDRKSTRLNSSHANIPYAVFCLKKKHMSTH